MPLDEAIELAFGAAAIAKQSISQELHAVVGRLSKRRHSPLQDRRRASASRALHERPLPLRAKDRLGVGYSRPIRHDDRRLHGPYLPFTAGGRLCAI